MPSSTGYAKLKQHEGLTTRLRKDHTEKGKVLKNRVIGYGYNVDSADDPTKDLIKSGVPVEDVPLILNGTKDITQAQADVLFDISVRRAGEDAKAVVANFDALGKPVQDVLINMSYQMGRKGLREFKRMRSALLNEDYGGAARELLHSDFAREQTPNRAKELSKQLLSYGEEVKKEKEAQPAPQSAVEQYRDNVRRRLSKTYNRQMLIDKVYKGIQTMKENQQAQDAAETKVNEGEKE